MIDEARRKLLQKPYVLPPDVLLFPVQELAEHVRAMLDCNDDDYAVTRPGMRSFSRIVDKDTAILLQTFRTPSPLAEAIARYSRQHNLVPEETLAQVFPALIRFSNAQFLVPADSPITESIHASFANGQMLAGYEVCRLIQVLQDVEVYQVQGKNGQLFALKIARPDTASSVSRALEHEAAILTHLHGVGSPQLAEQGQYRERPFLVTSWCPGVPINLPFWEHRLATSTSWRTRIHQLCCRLLDAYAQLHDHGVIHADVHPKNLLVDADNNITLLDFGLSRLLTSGTATDHNRRAGLAWFMEPELASALLNGEPPPPASYAGEQYAVAALVYYLICGAYPIAGVPEAGILYKEVVESPPLPFARHGFESWPDIESVLQRAMAKKAQARFPSLKLFSEAFRRAQPPTQRNQVDEVRPAAKMLSLVDAILERTVDAPRPLAELFTTAPTLSIQSGAAGLAWFLYRAAQIRNSPQLIVGADLWSRQALAQIDDSQGFELPAVSDKKINYRHVSLHHGRCGLHCVHALISHARGDMASTAQQVEEFLSAAQAGKSQNEFAFGHSGPIVGAAILLDVLRWSSRLSVKPLEQFLRETSRHTATRIAGLGDVGNDQTTPHLGIAHGWAGMLYAQLLAHKLLQTPPSVTLVKHLEQLAEKAVLHGRGISWVGTVQHMGQQNETPAHAPGWCSGSAGYLYLWCLAHELIQSPRYLELAIQTAWFAWEHADRHPRLCCGLSGRAFALLHVYRHTGDQVWLARAQQLARFAFNSTVESFAWDEHSLNLYWGALGPALLALELEQPERAVMPLFELEGWPGPYKG